MSGTAKPAADAVRCPAANEFTIVAFPTTALTVHAYPGRVNAKWRGNGAVSERVTSIVHDPEPPLDRNRLIVDASTELWAFPKSMTDRQGGTWYTIAYALRTGVPTLVIAPEPSHHTVYDTSGRQAFATKDLIGGLDLPR